MSEEKLAAASIVNFLKQQLQENTLSADARESVEVGIQCIETAFDLGPEDATRSLDLLQLLRKQVAGSSKTSKPVNKEAERAKNEGNELMKAALYPKALEKYTRAIELDPQNSVYFCNRAAAHFKLGQHEAAVADCNAALGIQPNYGKAHGRLGLALSALDRHSEARAAYARAAQLDPDNESYKQNLRLTDEHLAQRTERPAMELGFLQSPALLNMATEMLADPNLHDLISGLMTNAPQGPVGQVIGNLGGMNALLQAGQALTQHLQTSAPDLVEQLRRQMQPPGTGGNPPVNPPT